MDTLTNGGMTVRWLSRIRHSGPRYGHQMNLDDQHSMMLSNRELLLLGAGLKAYLNVFDAHRWEDAGASHSEGQWTELQNTVGRLLWRLEETGAGPQARVEHSPQARDPDG